MPATLRTLAGATLGATLLGGCAALDSLTGRGAASAEAELPPVSEAVVPGLGAANESPPPAPDSDVPIANPDRALMGRVQEMLNAKGFNAGPADGLSGPRTVRAIRLFKVARRMEVTDHVTPRLLDELGLKRP